MNTLDTTKRYTVVGLGASGRSVVRYLRAQGAVVFAVDQTDKAGIAESLEAEFPQLCFELGEIDISCLDNTDIVVVSPGVPNSAPVLVAARERGLDVIGDIEIFARVVTQPVVAVTGTNGKSTVVSMLDACGAASGLRVVAGGNLGTPALDMLSSSADVYVLELSSYQLETTRSLAPAAAALLNISPDHLDRYPGGFEDYVAAKQRVFQGAAVCVVPVDDRKAQPATLGTAQKLITVDAVVGGVGDVTLVSHQDSTWISIAASTVVDVSEIGAPGAHNVSNACFAAALAKQIGLDDDAIRTGLKTFGGLPHRTQLVRDVHGVQFFNDSKGTNVGATCTALDGMSRPTVLIAGGVGKSQDFKPLAEKLAERACGLVLFGRDARQIAADVDGVVPVSFASDLDDAVSAARALARDGDAVLFSPACSSFDMFPNFEVRGDAFMQVVEALPQ